MKSLTVVLLFSLLPFCLKTHTILAQNRYESEQIYLNVVRRSALQGDTLFLQGLIKASDPQRTVPLSRYAYVELIGPGDSVLVRQKIACNEKGIFRAALPTDYFWPDAVYYLRAYTRMMQNFNPATFPVVAVMLGKSVTFGEKACPDNEVSSRHATSLGKETPPEKETPAGNTAPYRIKTNGSEKNEENAAIACAFYPEGGHWLPDVLQSLVFYLYDRHGRPVQSDRLLLQNSRKDTLLHARTSRSGLGRLIFTPAADETYYLTVAGSPDAALAFPLSSGISQPSAFPLPPVRTGTLLQAQVNRGRISYRIHFTAPAPETNFRLFLLHASGEWEEIPLPADRIQTGKVQTIEGIIRMNPVGGERVSLFLTDDSVRLLSERHLWIEGPQTAHLPTETQARTDTFAQTQTPPRMPVQTPVLTWPDGPFPPGEPIPYALSGLPCASTVFARIEKTEDELTPPCQAVARLYFQNTLASSCPFPLQTDARRDGASLQEWDDWLCTARFVQWNPEEGLKGNFHYRYPFEDKLFFSGRVRRKNGRPLKGGSLIAYNTVSNAVYEAGLDAEGRFTIGLDDFPEGTSFFLQAYDAKNGTDFYTYEIDEERYPPVWLPPIRPAASAAYGNRNDGAAGRQVAPGNAPSETEISPSNATEPATQTGPILRKGNEPESYILPEITVKARLSEKKPVYEEKFYSVNFKDTRTIEQRHYPSLKEILEDLPGVRLRHNDLEGKIEDGDDSDGSVWSLFSTRGSSTLDSPGLPILLDGRRESLDLLIHMPAQEIASVELLRPWQTQIYLTGAIDGAVLVRSQEYRPEKRPPAKGIYYTPLGLSAAERPADACSQGKAPVSLPEAPSSQLPSQPTTAAGGIALPPLVAPLSPGTYAVWIDLAAPQGDCFSFCREIRVAPAANRSPAN